MPIATPFVLGSFGWRARLTQSFKRSCLALEDQVMNCAVDAWSMTVARLGDGTVNKRVDEHGSALNGSSALRWEESARIPIARVLEKPTAHTLIVSRCDARFGHYGYQTWRAAVARVPGICVLTGRPIEVGDAIFKPRPVAQTPANADAMICTKGVSTSKQPT